MCIMACAYIMKTYLKYLIVLSSILTSNLTTANDTPRISHGPMLGAVSEHAANIWVLTTTPTDVTCTLSEVGSTLGELTQKVHTTPESDHTCTIRFDKLKKETQYRYVVRVGKSKHQASFTTLSSSLTPKGIRIVYGYGYNHTENKMKPGTSVFTKMAGKGSTTWMNARSSSLSFLKTACVG